MNSLRQGIKLTLLGGILLVLAQCKGKTTVYVCSSGTAARYHYRSACPALSHCTYQIEATTKEEAEKEGKTLCKWEQ